MRNVTHLSQRAASSPSVVAYAAFAAFGMFWGGWGAALPSIRAQALLSDGQLGTALLFVGAGALPAMLLTGRMLDRFGARPAALILALLGAAGVGVAVSAQGFVSVVVSMLLVGAASGAADVAINTLAGQSEHQSSRAVLTRSHGVFSLAVVVSSLGTGALLTQNLGLTVTFTVIAAIMLALAAAVWAKVPERVHFAHPETAVDSAVIRPMRGTTSVHALLLLGVIGALAYATENAHQSWGAVFMTDNFAASPQLAALAPATFAAAATLARFALAPLSRSHPIALLLTGGAVATAGSLILAAAPNAPTGLLGLAIAAAGTAVLFPTLLSHSLRHIEPARRGRAISVITTTAYLGFLLGPAYVGLLADLAGLRLALIAVAALALIFTIAAAPASRYTQLILRTTCPRASFVGGFGAHRRS
ncbi:MFS transporter [Nesterenkonia ebinurensis]|uniref:MFS transporter n=1 Tax=Nesterenkonia ebinurensis TaxID=2608252 RepID=UPI00168AC705|nr:MFS transporter [Nesterenkonia ebinurensis]